MNQTIKIVLIAFLVVGVVSAIVVFTVPSVKMMVFGEKGEAVEGVEGEEAGEGDGQTDETKPFKKKSKSSIKATMTLKEVEDFAEILAKKERNLGLREETLRIREERFKGRETEILRREKEIREMLQTMSQYIPEITEAEKKNIRKLAKMFETLSPKNANPLIAQMPDQTVVNIFSLMKPRNSAKLLGAYASLNGESARRAAKLTEMIKKLVIK